MHFHNSHGRRVGATDPGSRLLFFLSSRVCPQSQEELPHPFALGSAASKFAPHEVQSNAIRQRPIRGRRDSDPSKTYRNLYVSNLPLNVNTDQLAALFQQYGTVTHCVILSTLDTQARRRGFIVMSAPDESRCAIKGLNGFVWFGYPVEVSFALVQRSGGPLDPDTESAVSRNVPRSRYNTGPRKNADESSYSGTDISAAFVDAADPALPANYGNPLQRGPEEVEDPTSIVVSGLDPVAIIDDDDFRRIMEPYGSIAAATLCRDDRGASRGFGIVTFENEQDATRATAQLNQREIHGRRLRAQRYVYSRGNSDSLQLQGLTASCWRSSSPNITYSGPSTPLTPSFAGLSASIHAPPSAALPMASARCLTDSRSYSSGGCILPAQVEQQRNADDNLLGLFGSMSIASRTLGGAAQLTSMASPLSGTPSFTPRSRSGLETTASFFQPRNSTLRISLRPDPLDSSSLLGRKPSDLANAPELGDAFEQLPTLSGTAQKGKDSTGSPEDTRSSSLISKTASMSPWSTDSTSSLTADRLSPYTTFYSASPSNSAVALRAPEQQSDKEVGAPNLPSRDLFGPLKDDADKDQAWSAIAKSATPDLQNNGPKRPVK